MLLHTVVVELMLFLLTRAPPAVSPLDVGVHAAHPSIDPFIDLLLNIIVELANSGWLVLSESPSDPEHRASTYVTTAPPSPCHVALRRFARWGMGHGQLIDLHPKFAFRDAPNIAESIILAPIVAAITFPVLDPSAAADDECRSFGRTMQAAIAIVFAAPCCVVLSEIVCDAFANSRRWHPVPGFTSVVAQFVGLAEASMIIAILEFGRMLGHWERRGLIGVMNSFCKRFEWYCGRLAGAMGHVRRRSFTKFVLRILTIVTMCLFFVRLSPCPREEAEMRG